MKKREKKCVEIDVEVVSQTEDAMLFTDGINEFWVPKSVMDDYPEDGDGVAVIEEWFAEQKGLV